MDNSQENGYNKEPVCYCKQCLSLNIKTEEGLEIDYCDTCGSTDLGVTDIFKWEELVKQKELNNKESNG